MSGPFVTFRHSAMIPNNISLNLGRIPKFGEISLIVNTSTNNNPVILYLDSPDILNRPDYFTTTYPLTKDIDIATTCDWIYRACIWYAPYLGRNDLTPVYIYTLQYLDKLITSTPITTPHERIQMINKLKAYLMCDPSSTSMPLISAKLDMLMEEEAKARLQAHKAKRIQCHWRKVVVNPYHIVCQRRLMREFQNMVEAY